MTNEPRPYILQKGGSACALVTLCNAMRYQGQDSPMPGTEEWDDLVTLIAADHGAAIYPEKAYQRLGYTRTPISVGDVPDNLPAEVQVWNPDVGCSLHSTLVVRATDTHWTLVNYRWRKGPVVEDVPVEDLDDILPSEGNVNRKCWSIKPGARNHE